MGFLSWQTQILLFGSGIVYLIIAHNKKFFPFNKGGPMDTASDLLSVDEDTPATPLPPQGPIPLNPRTELDLGNGFKMPIPPGGTSSGNGYLPGQRGPTMPFVSTVANDPTPTDYGIYTQYLNGLRNEYQKMDEQRRLANTQQIGIGGDITTLPQPPTVGQVPYGVTAGLPPAPFRTMPPPYMQFRPQIPYMPMRYPPATHYSAGSNITLKTPIGPGTTFGDGSNITLSFPIPPGVTFGSGSNITAPGPLPPDTIVGAGSTYNGQPVVRGYVGGNAPPITSFNGTPIGGDVFTGSGGLFNTSSPNVVNNTNGWITNPSGMQQDLTNSIRERVRSQLEAAGIHTSFRAKAKNATFVNYDEGPAPSIPSDINAINPTYFNMVSRNQPMGMMSNKLGNI